MPLISRLRPLDSGSDWCIRIWLFLRVRRLWLNPISLPRKFLRPAKAGAAVDSSSRRCDQIRRPLTLLPASTCLRKELIGFLFADLIHINLSTQRACRKAVRQSDDHYVIFDLNMNLEKTA